MDSANIVVAGNLRMYIAAAGTDAPLSTGVGAVAYGEAWAAPWVEIGHTTEGLSKKHEIETLKRTSDQVRGTVRTFITGETMTLATKMLEATLANIKRAVGYGSLTLGVDENILAFDGDASVLEEFAFGVEGLAPGSTAAAPLFRRLVVPKANVDPNVEIGFQQSETYEVPFSLEALADPTAPVGKRFYRYIDEPAAA